MRVNDPGIAQLRRTPRLLAKGPGYVLYALMDFIVDQYRPIVQRLEEEGQEVEEGILDGALGFGSVVGRKYYVKVVLGISP